MMREYDDPLAGPRRLRALALEPRELLRAERSVPGLRLAKVRRFHACEFLFRRRALRRARGMRISAHIVSIEHHKPKRFAFERVTSPLHRQPARHPRFLRIEHLEIVVAH